MDLTIKDGTGKGNKAKVNSENRLSTTAVTVTQQQLQSAQGNSYQLGSGVVNLTSASESAVLYVKNDDDRTLGLSGVNITSTAFTGSSSGVVLAKVYLLGTGLSSSTTNSPLNNNFGSSKSANVEVLAGAEAATVTNGTVVGAFYIPVDTFFYTDIAWVLPKGSSVAVTLTPATGNTSFNATITLEGVFFGEL